MKLPFFAGFLTDPASFRRYSGTMRTLIVVFILALISIGFEAYSDAALTSAEVPHGALDPVTTAVAHGLKRG
jgi:hypothetical protein